MDSHGWRLVYQHIRQADRSVPRYGRRPTYPDVLIVGMYLWTVAHDRPLCWACDRSHYGSLFRPRRLPSVSQFCRRIQTLRCQEILQFVHARLAQDEAITPLSFVDGRALVVGKHSRDPDAAIGWGRGRFERGYKLHAWATQDWRIPLWSVTPLNVDERAVARRLVQQQPCGGLILADALYDSGPLYEHVAALGAQWLTPMGKSNAGRGHRKPYPARLAAVSAWRGVAGYVHQERNTIERIFGSQSTLGGGLGPLPGWVRRLDRVRRWVGAKLILYHARLIVRRAAV